MPAVVSGFTVTVWASGSTAKKEGMVSLRGCQKESP
jgi:hypothetical protein